MSDELKKEAAGELTARLARWASTPIPGTPKLFMKVRSKGELDALEGGIRSGTQKYVVDPIRKGLLKIKADKAFAGMSRPFYKPEKAQAFGQRAVDLIAESPHIAAAHASPIPGAGIAMHGIEHGKNWFLNKTPGLPVPRKIKTAMFEAFSKELQKIAEHKVYTDVEDIEKKLKPGDILATQPNENRRISDKIIRFGLKLFQGTPFTHTGIYVGDGKVVDAGLWGEKGNKVVTVPIKKYVDRYSFRVLRVRDTTRNEIKDAVDFAKKQVGKEFSFKGLLRLALPVGKNEKGERKRQELDKMFCSQLVANAYPDKPFAKDRKMEHVRPVDIQKSTLTKVVAEFDGKEKTASPFPGFVTDIDEATNKNTNYRKVLHTAKKEQLVAMSLPAGGDIGAEKHPHTDQFVRVEGGKGKAVLNGSSRPIKDGTALVIPSGVHHNVVNTGKKPLKIYTVYSKQEHPDGIVEKTKADAQRMEKSAQVMPYQQETQWTCSVACLKAVMAHYGIDMAETEILPYVGASEGRGAETHEIAEAARALGLEATEFSFDTLDQAKILLDQDIPIICDIQSFNHPGKGHYVVLTQIDEAGVHLMDPNTPGNSRVITPEEMDQRWWDRAMAPPHNVMSKWGIIVLPPVG